jgi:hypothetical protein
MKVYLAGKVDAKYGAWREAIVGRFPGRWDDTQKAMVSNGPRWRVERPYVNDDDLLYYPDGWPELDRAVLGLHTYVGPYRAEWWPKVDGKTTGDWHGSIIRGSHGMADDPTIERQIVQCCRRAIYNADLVFAYINSPDAYGTIAEIGYAAAYGKFVSLLIGPRVEFDYKDFWFLQRIVNHSPAYPYVLDERGVMVWDDAHNDYLTEPEDRATVGALKDAIVAYAAWTPPRKELHDMKDRVAASMVRQSFEQIAQWSSDPRVRNEAKRMMRQLT